MDANTESRLSDAERIERLSLHELTSAIEWIMTGREGPRPNPAAAPRQRLAERFASAIPPREDEREATNADD